MAITLPPSGDLLVLGVGMAPAATIRGLGFPVEHAEGGVLQRGVVADGLAVGDVVAQGEFQRADRVVDTSS